MMNTWPLWECIETESLAKLRQLQEDTYGTRLDLLADIYRDVESLEEIDRLMRQRPRYTGKVWQGG